jgi:hypothetical protein
MLATGETDVRPFDLGAPLLSLIMLIPLFLYYFVYDSII